MATKLTKKEDEYVSDYRAHTCNCEFCLKKHACYICGSVNELQRAHRVPQHLFYHFEVDKRFREEIDRNFLEMRPENIVILCKKHHKEFDNFTLKELSLLVPIILRKVIEFSVLVKVAKPKTTTKGFRAISKYINKINPYLTDKGVDLKVSGTQYV